MALNCLDLLTSGSYHWKEKRLAQTCFKQPSFVLRSGRWWKSRHFRTSPSYCLVLDALKALCVHLPSKPSETPGLSHELSLWVLVRGGETAGRTWLPFLAHRKAWRTKEIFTFVSFPNTTGDLAYCGGICDFVEPGHNSRSEAAGRSQLLFCLKEGLFYILFKGPG